jgi:type IV pilus assembly protein PilA
MTTVSPHSRRGFTLVELMIIVAVIGLLSAIAIPNFMRYAARSKQTEAKSNLKAAFTTQRSQFQESDKYQTSVRVLNFSPERGNRYYYAFNAAPASVENRSTVNVVTATTDEAVSVDTFKYPGMNPAPPRSPFAPAWAANEGIAPAAVGVTGVCPDCNFLADATANIDNEAVGIDHWIVSSVDFTQVPVCGDPTSSQTPAGQPFNNYDDVACP